MTSLKLIPFGEKIPSGISGVEVDAESGQGQLKLTYKLRSGADSVSLPAPAPARRQDELWKHTCFEVFVATVTGYREYNFSPSGAWAAYDFSGYREGMQNAVVPAPQLDFRRIEDGWQLKALIDIPPTAARLALSAIIEGSDGSCTFWALAHAPDKPDFHHPSSFVLKLDAP